MTRWFPWGNTSNDEKPSQQDNEVAPKDTPGIQSDPLTGQHDDAMLVDARVESIANSTQEQKHDDSLGDNTESSLHNHAEETVRVVKRPKTESDMDEDNIEYVSPSKKPRSPAPQSDAESLPPQAHETERVDSPNNADHSAALNDTGFEDHPEPNTNLLRNLETRPITVPQLIQEVKGIYAGLVMVEKKCTEIVTQQTTNPTKLSKEQWQALIALHRTLLNEHHDFFSASHHPITKGHELRELAARYAMPARMWRHGIHAFLELLRHRLPDSLEHMLSFVYLAYSMMALLKETVPDFEETWIECLGDLARYRMAIEEVDLRDREVWSNTARTWYNEAADLSPNTGRIQHHLAVLARPNIVQQLFLYSKALVAAIPFKNAGESILLLFNPLLDQPSASTSRYQPAELSFVCAAAVLFKRRSATEFEKHRAQFASHLEGHMTRSGSRFKVQGPEFAGALFAMLMDFGNAENHLWSLLFKHQQDMKQQYCDKHAKEVDKLPKDFVVQEPELINPKRAEYWARSDIHHVQVEVPGSRLEKEAMLSDDVTSYVGPMLYKTIADVAGQIGNKNVVPFMHQILAHLHALTWIPGASIYVERYIPWDSLVQFLNTVGRSGVSYENVEHDEFPRSFGGNKRQLPEDFVMRGLMSMTTYYGANFFKPEDLVDEDERLLEQPSHQAPRVERCLYCAIQLTKLTNRWMSYDYKDKKFSTTEFFREIREP